MIWSPDGRINRLQYLAFAAICLVVSGVVLAVLTLLMLALRMAGIQWLNLIGLAAVSYLIFCLDAKRLHDLNWPAAVAAVPVAVPFLRALLTVMSMGSGAIPSALGQSSDLLTTLARAASIGLSLVLVLGRGRTGPNRYGADPSRPAPSPADRF